MDLIKNACEIICNSANAFLENIERRPNPWVVLTSIVDHDGSQNQSARDAVVMAIYNITKESFASSYQPTTPAQISDQGVAGLSVVSPPIYVDLHVMFMANFTEKSYPEGLAALSKLIFCFQQTPVFTHQSAPDLAPEITKLTLEIENLPLIDVNYVMGMLGTKYLPSVFYKIRMLPFASQAMSARTYPVTGAGSGIAQEGL